MAEDAAQSPPPPPPPLSIMALDDDPDFREFIASALESEGHAVRTVGTPGELFAEAERSLPEVILLDIKMGRERGEDVLKQIRERWPRACVIVVTGYPSLDSMRETFKRDVFDYLAKPFKMDELRRALGQAADEFALGRRAVDRLRADLGRQIRLARTEKDWTLRDLSEASGVSVSQLSSVERGAHLPSLESLVAISEALGHRPSAWLASMGL